MSLDYLVIGHLTADVLPDGSVQPGGTAWYSALAAWRLGLRVAIFTACAADLDLAALPGEIALHRVDAPHSTTFVNRYTGNARSQWLQAVAPPLDLAGLPPAWHEAAIVHLGPVANELRLPVRFPGVLLGATPQGFVRRWDAAGRVTAEPERLAALDLAGVQVVVLSEEDVNGDEALLLPLLTGRIVVLTRAERGATLWDAGVRHEVAALPATVVDPTGAGDVWAAAFLIALHGGHSPVAAARWACAAAACAIEGMGITALPTQAIVAARLRDAGEPRHARNVLGVAT